MASLRQQFTLAAKKLGYELVNFESGGTDGGNFCWEIAIKRISDGQLFTSSPGWHDGVLDLDLEKGEEIEFFEGGIFDLTLLFKL